MGCINTPLKTPEFMLGKIFPCILIGLIQLTLILTPGWGFFEELALTHFNRLIRGIVLRGAEIQSMWDELLALALFMSVALTLAILRCNKRLD